MAVRPRTRLAATLIAVVVALSVVLPAQQPPIFRSGVELLEVDASVLGRDGNPIADLQASDFSVTVDGEPRTVVQAQFISLRAPAASAPPADSLAVDAAYSSNADADPGRLIVILVDEESIPFGEGRHVMQAAGEFVDSLSPGDRVALVAMPQPGIYIDFTSDHDRVSRAVASMSGLGVGPVGDGVGGGDDGRGEDGGDAATFGPGPGPVGGSGGSMRVLLETRRRTETVRHDIETILEALQGVEGTKALVWISGGFNIDGAVLGLQKMAELAAASRTTLYVFMVAEPLADAARAVGGALPETFVVEAPPGPGFAGLWLGPPNRRRLQQGLMAAASMTGGSLVRAQYNPGPLFTRLERELSGYYLLGVESLAADRDGEFHEIDVSVGREGAHVRSHRGVHVPPEGPGPEERIMRVLRSPVPARELPLRVATYVYRGAGSESAHMQILVGAEIDAAGNVPETLTMGYLLHDPEGAVASHATVQVTPRLVQKPDGPVFEIDFLIRAERPDTYSLKLAAIDATGRRGSVEHVVPAPRNLNEGLVVGDLMLIDQASAPRGEILPQTEAQVSSGNLLAYTEVYTDSPALWEHTEVEVDVLDGATGLVLARGGTSLESLDDDASRRWVTAVLALHRLTPGRYVARARVMHDATEVAQVRRPFRVTSPPIPQATLPDPAPPARPAAR